MAKTDKIIFGMHPVETLLKSEHTIKKVLIEKDEDGHRFNEIIKLCADKKVPCEEKNRRFLDNLSNKGLHQGVVAFFTPHELQICFESQAVKPRIHSWLCLYFDRIQDPQNFGAMVRSAEYFAVDQVFYPAYHHAPFNEVALKTSAGAGLINRPYKITSEGNFFKSIQKHQFQIIGTCPHEGKNFKDINWLKPTLLVIGHEGEGMSDDIKRQCHDHVKIPRYGDMESLNASVSLGVCLFKINELKLPSE